MAQETGLNKTQIYNLRNAWFYKKRNFKRMYPSLANALVEFWNSHLFNDSRAKSAFKRVYKSKPASQEMAMCAVAILVAKVGMAKTEKLLTKRGKSAIFTQFLESLSPEQLADMV